MKERNVEEDRFVEKIKGKSVEIVEDLGLSS